MTLKLFEVAGEDPDYRPSPYCWRTRMALTHKGLAFEPVPWRAVEKSRIAKSGGGTVPVLVDGDLWLRESWDIAVHLERAYPERPALFAGEGDLTKARFLEAWANRELHLPMARALLADGFPLLAEKDKAYYLERTKRVFGQTLQALCSDPDSAIAVLQERLEPLQSVLAESDYLGGAAPGYGDYILFGSFQWARVASTRRLIPAKSAVARWFQALLAAFDGFAARQPARDHWV